MISSSDCVANESHVMTNRAPLIVVAAVLLLLFLYVGSYFALVVPSGVGIYMDDRTRIDPYLGTSINYRWGGATANTIFWPLEQIDRKLRPKAWWG